MRFRVDFEAQRVAFLAVGRARLVGAAIGHQDRDVVIIGVNAFLHRAYLESSMRRVYSGRTGASQLSWVYAFPAKAGTHRSAHEWLKSGSRLSPGMRSGMVSSVSLRPRDIAS